MVKYAETQYKLFWGNVREVKFQDEVKPKVRAPCASFDLFNLKQEKLFIKFILSK